VIDETVATWEGLSPGSETNGYLVKSLPRPNTLADGPSGSSRLPPYELVLSGKLDGYRVVAADNPVSDKRSGLGGGAALPPQFAASYEFSYVPVEIKHRTLPFLGKPLPMYEIVQLHAYMYLCSGSVRSIEVLEVLRSSTSGFFHNTRTAAFDNSMWETTVVALHKFAEALARLASDRFLLLSFLRHNKDDQESLLYAWIDCSESP
jgi:hypothetical protein